MAELIVHLDAVRTVAGQQWIEQPGTREFEWALLRRRWCDDLQEGGWRLGGAPRETTEYDEGAGQVLLRIDAPVWRGNAAT